MDGMIKTILSYLYFMFPVVMDGEVSLMSWSLVLYPVSWLACILYLCLFFSLILMRLKLNLVNGLYALDFCTSAVFILIEVQLCLALLGVISQLIILYNNISSYYSYIISIKFVLLVTCTSRMKMFKN